MAKRFYCETAIHGRSLCTIVGPEAHHMTRVMRVVAGDEVTVFDGHGGEYPATVTAVARDQVSLELGHHDPIERELPFELTLGVALPKGDRQKWLVEKAVELGVSRLVPLETRFGVAQPTSAAVDRLRRTVISASKQCGRNRLMEIIKGTPVTTFLDDCSGDALKLLADPSATECPPSSRAERVCLIVGPEGGLSDDELESAIAAQWRTVSLGDRILRTETAALALIAQVHTAR